MGRRAGLRGHRPCIAVPRSRFRCHRVDPSLREVVGEGSRRRSNAAAVRRGDISAVREFATGDGRPIHADVQRSAVGFVAVSGGIRALDGERRIGRDNARTVAVDLLREIERARVQVSRVIKGGFDIRVRHDGDGPPACDLCRPPREWRIVDQVELATLEWGWWWNSSGLLTSSTCDPAKRSRTPTTLSTNQPARRLPSSSPDRNESRADLTDAYSILPASRRISCTA